MVTRFEHMYALLTGWCVALIEQAVGHERTTAMQCMVVADNPALMSYLGQSAGSRTPLTAIDKDLLQLWYIFTCWFPIGADLRDLSSPRSTFVWCRTAAAAVGNSETVVNLRRNSWRSPTETLVDHQMETVVDLVWERQVQTVSTPQVSTNSVVASDF
jgi:hypothetical protein